MTIDLLWALLLIHAAATWTLVGVIWVMQLVHYPLFALVGESQFREYERRHQRAITWIVAPTMLIELLSAVALVLLATEGWAWLAWTGLGLVGVNALTTGLVQGPLHSRLERGFDPALHKRLMTSNWVRTAAWTLRGAITLIMLSYAD